MKIPYKWLLEFISWEKSAQELCDFLTLSGIEANYIFDIGEKVEGVVTAEIIKVMNHPNANNLKVCLVSDGKQLNSVVCGAPNVKKGIKVAYAKSGSRIAGGRVISKLKIRGQVSNGMLLSEKELGWGGSHEGIYIFPENVLLGKDVNELKGSGEEILDIEITADRPDLLSIYGLAREISLLTGANLRHWEVERFEEFEVDKSIDVEIKSKYCEFYSGRIVEGVCVKESSEWMTEKLSLCGIKSINNIVDITNYLLIQYGQPLHAFDLDKIKGEIIVREAEAGEEVVLLDGNNYVMKGGELVIADTEKILALAGVMGGEFSKVTEETKDIFIESAYFSPSKVMESSRKHNLTTESSYRFSRGVDPEGVIKVLEEATLMASKFCGGKIKRGRIESGKLKFIFPGIEIRKNSIRKILGRDFEEEKIKDILKRLSKNFQVTEDKFIFVSPSWRKGLVSEVDVVSEIGRLIGYDKIPSKIPVLRWVPSLYSLREKNYKEIKKKLTGLGFFEVVNNPLIDLKFSEEFFKDNFVKIENPLTRNQSVLAPTLLYGFLNNIKFNFFRNEFNIFLFELSKVFDRRNGEQRALGIIGVGERVKSYERNVNKFDFFELKGIVNSIFRDLKFSEYYEEKSSYSIFSPVQLKYINKKDETIAIIGEVGGNVKKYFDLKLNAFYAEIYLDRIPINEIKEVIIKKYFPPVIRDLSVVASDKLTYKDIYSKISQSGGEVLREIKLVDIYKGKPLKENQKSYTFRLVFQKDDTTLTDSFVDDRINKILEEIAKIGIYLR